MSALFGPRNFEERLQLAFRGSAKEQKKSTKDFTKKRRATFLEKKQGPTLGGSVVAKGGNVFATKQNLGGTQR